MLPPDDKKFIVRLGDCIPAMAAGPAAFADFSVFSPPFPALYAYTSEAGDIGNSEDLNGEAKLHLSFFYRQLARALKPGRVAVVHVSQIVRMKRSGGEGLYDFRGLNIRLAQRAGLVYDFDWLVRKNPQAQAIRTKSWNLKFQGIETDRSISRGALGDYLIKFRAPGENAVPIVGPEVSRNDWIAWAEGAWTDIRETDTLNVREGRGEGDTKHICPLQLGVIRRLVRLYTNPGEVVYSPFAGIGSEGYESLKLGRRFVGDELKPEYHTTCIRNCERAIAELADEGVTLWNLPAESAPATPAQPQTKEPSHGSDSDKGKGVPKASKARGGGGKPIARAGGTAGRGKSGGTAAADRGNRKRDL